MNPVTAEKRVLPKLERRKEPRVPLPFPATVFGADPEGGHFERGTVLKNLSGGGLYLDLDHPVERGDTLWVILRSFASPLIRREGLRVEYRCTVLRVDLKPNGAFGVACGFTKQQKYVM